jgi:hypothetical protein
MIDQSPQTTARMQPKQNLPNSTGPKCPNPPTSQNRLPRPMSQMSQPTSPSPLSLNLLHSPLFQSTNTTKASAQSHVSNVPTCPLRQTFSILPSLTYPTTPTTPTTLSPSHSNFAGGIRKVPAKTLSQMSQSTNFAKASALFYVSIVPIHKPLAHINTKPCHKCPNLPTSPNLLHSSMSQLSQPTNQALSGLCWRMKGRVHMSIVAGTGRWLVLAQWYLCPILPEISFANRVLKGLAPSLLLIPHAL